VTTLTYTTDTSRRIAPTLEFQVDGETYVAIKPKQYTWVSLVRAIKGAAEFEEQLAVMGSFLNWCMDPEDASRLARRLHDPTQNIDLRDSDQGPGLMTIVLDLLKHWGREDGQELEAIGIATKVERPAPRKRAPAKKR